MPSHNNNNGYSLMPMRRVLVAALVSLVILPGLLAARTLDQPPAYLKNEGKFVTYPARAVSALATLVGGVIALPAAVISTPIGLAAGDPLGYGLLPSAVVGAGLGEAGYHLGGAVPYALKKTFYDGPLLASQKLKGDPASGLVAQVDPPPAVTPVDIQYLASTPSEARVPVVPSREYSVALPPPRQPTSLMLKRQLSPFKLPPAAAAAPAATRSSSLSRTSPAMPPPPAPVPAAAAPRPQPAPATSASAPADAGLPVLPALPVRASQPEPAAAPAEAEAEPEAERPSLKKKKRKFSERFGF